MSPPTVFCPSARSFSGFRHKILRPGLVRAGILACIVAAWLLGTAGEAQAQLTAVRVEEDWRIEIATPETSTNLPQLTNVMSPKPNIDGAHCVFELNHRTLPSYTAGSMQLQCWFGDNEVTYRNSPKLNQLSHPDEVITYTIRMSVGGGTARFEILNGTSTSWGEDFGGGGLFRASISTNVLDLGAYSPDFSVKRSKVGYGSNRVKKFALVRVRYYAADGTLLHTDTTERVVHKLD